MNVRTIAGILLVTALVVFIAANAETTRVWLFGIRVEMPLALVVFFSAALGAAAALLFGWISRRRGSGPAA